MKRWSVLGGFLLIAALLGGGIFMAQRDPGFTRKIPSPLIDKPAPAFALPDLVEQGKTVRASDFAGRVWLLNVWGSWCAECWREHPYLVQLSQQGVPIVGLNWRDERADALEMLRRGGSPYVAIPYDFEGSAAIDWGVYGAPETFVIDKRGVIRHKHVGGLHQQLWDDEFAPLIARLNAE